MFTLVLGISTITNAQTPTHFTKSEVGEKGCTVYTPELNPKFDKSMSEDGSAVFTWEKTVNETHYMIIHVELKDALTGGDTEKQALLKGYLDFLKKQLGVSETTIYGMGHTSERNPQALGIIDYWQDNSDPKTPMQYFVKGWVSPQLMTIYMIGRTDDKLNEGLKSLFTNGFQHKYLTP
jgi:hypothetical protein